LLKNEFYSIKSNKRKQTLHSNFLEAGCGSLSLEGVPHIGGMVLGGVSWAWIRH